jgi:hypothetical protein
MTRFIADENIPSRVIGRLPDAGHDVVTVDEAASAGIRNYEFAELSARIGRVVLTRDADFTTKAIPEAEDEGHLHTWFRRSTATGRPSLVAHWSLFETSRGM